MRNKTILWLAQGFGAGRIPFAPGTFGSVVGLGWFALLLATGSGWLYLGGTVAGIFLSVWVCGEAEKILGRKDPGSVVLDEIVAMPVCFAWLVTEHGNPAWFAEKWGFTLAVFGAFRWFDIAKPWPIRQSQALPGGWGVTVDDVLAAACVNGVVFAAFKLVPV